MDGHCTLLPVTKEWAIQTVRINLVLEYYRKAVEITPGFLPAYYSQIQPLCYLKRFDEAMKAIDEFEKLSTHSDEAKFFRAYVEAHKGEKEKARKMIYETDSEELGGLISQYLIALTCFVLGDLDRAFELMERAYQRGEHELLNLAVDRELDNVRSDPRYLSLLKKIGFN
jgi:tetratricopeptide (TPR) repeat protein